MASEQGTQGVSYEKVGALPLYSAAAWYVLGVLYFALVGRHKLVLSPEEDFAMKHRRKA